MATIDIPASVAIDDDDEGRSAIVPSEVRQAARELAEAGAREVAVRASWNQVDTGYAHTGYYVEWRIHYINLFGVEQRITLPDDLNIPAVITGHVEHLRRTATHWAAQNGGA